MLQIPLTSVPAQTLSVVLDAQAAQIAVYQKGASMYLDLTVSQGSTRLPIVLTRICRNKQRLLLDAQYRGFRGELMFVDTQGETEPEYAGLGTRYQLLYLTEAEALG